MRGAGDIRGNVDQDRAKRQPYHRHDGAAFLRCVLRHHWVRRPSTDGRHHRPGHPHERRVDRALLHAHVADLPEVVIQPVKKDVFEIVGRKVDGGQEHEVTIAEQFLPWRG